MTSEVMFRDCAPGDVLYRSKEYLGGVFFTITLLDFDPVPESAVQFEMKYCLARVQICLAIPVNDYGVIPSDFNLPATVNKQILGEELYSSWGYDNILPGYRCRKETLQSTNVQEVFQRLCDWGVAVCTELENIIKDKAQVQQIVDQKRKEVLSTFKVKYQLLNSEPTDVK